MGRDGHTDNRDGCAVDVHQRAVLLAVEMVMIAGVGVEIGARTVDGYFAQQPCARELMHGVVDRCERYAYARAHDFLMQRLCRDMAVATTKEQGGKRQTLARRTQTGVTQLVDVVLRQPSH